MNKLDAIKALITSEHYVLITQKRRVSCTPKWGHTSYWNEARKAFDAMKRSADRMQRDGSSSRKGLKDGAGSL